MPSKYRSILVPLDGSDLAEHALPMALSLARRHGAALYIVRVYVPLAGAYGEHAVRYHTVTNDQALDRELMRQAREYLDDTITRMASAAGIQATAELREGPIADTISNHAATVGAALLVMTTQGRGPLGRFWLGSVSDELVRQAGIPILFMRPEAKPVDLTQERFLRRVLIPLDESALAETILEPVLALADTPHAEYTLLRVVRPTAELSYSPAGRTVANFQESLNFLRELEQGESKRAHEYLEALAARLRGQSVNVQTRVVTSARPANAILDDAAAHDVDLIALATRGQGGLKRLVLGSVADKLLRGAETPVFVYRPPDHSSAEQ